MTHENKVARCAGLIYLIVFVTGMFSLVYVPSQIAVADDLPTTVDRILASQMLFRLHIASTLVMQAAFLLLPLVLYRLLREVNQHAAVLMVALAVVSVPLGLVSLSHRLDVLSLLMNSSSAPQLGSAQLQLAVRQSLDAYGNGLQITSVFWGLWLLPFGYLVMKSDFLPTLLGALLVLGGLGYVVDVFGGLLVASYADSSLARYILLPASVGEVGMILWLLLAGIQRPPATTSA